jgi:hypothetical protein
VGVVIPRDDLALPDHPRLDFDMSLKYEDMVFGRTGETRIGEEPYSLLHDFRFDPDVAACLPERSRVHIRHLPSGRKIGALVDWFAVDEDEFSCPVFVDEAAVEAFVAACATSAVHPSNS